MGKSDCEGLEIVHFFAFCYWYYLLDMQSVMLALSTKFKRRRPNVMEESKKMLKFGNTNFQIRSHIN